MSPDFRTDGYGDLKKRHNLSSASHMIRQSHLNQKEMHMIWAFLLLSALGLTFVKLGSYSVWVVVFATMLKIALIVIAVLVALLIWTKVIKKKERPVTTINPRNIT